MSRRNDLLRATISVDRTYFRKDDFAIITCSIYRLEEDSIEPITGPYGSITLKGTMPMLKEDGTLYKITGEYVNDPKYGDQYNVVSIFPAVEFGDNDPRGQKQFLLSLFTENQVNAMYEALESPFMALKNGDVDALITVKGCGTASATAWIDRFQSHIAMAKIFTELEEYELSNVMIEKLMARYKSPDLVIEKVRNNPYILATQIKGIGFKTADKIALAGGIEPDSPERIGAFTIFHLDECGENGKSWIYSENLVGAIIETLNFDDETTDEVIKNGVLSVDEQLWWSEDKSMVGLKRYYDIETKIAEELLRLRNAESRITCENWREKVAELERIQGWEYTEEQLIGIETGLTNNVTIITGFSGTGKSSVVKGILSTYKGYSFAQVALSGRAASRLTEITGKEGSTIHRALGYPKGEPRHQGFLYNEENPLTEDIFILDEISMVDSFLFYYLLRAIPSGSKVYLLGDIGQLESIGAGNIAHDMINSGEIPTVHLTKIHRQASKSAIVTESIKVRNGEQLVDKEWAGTETRGELQDLTLKCFSDKSNTYHEVIKAFKHYYEADDFDIMETQIIVPTKVRGDACTYQLNNAIQQIYNPDEHKYSIDLFKEGKQYTLRVGDKVINRVNNYNTSPFIYNGNMGILERFTFDDELESDVMIINFKAIGRVKVPKKYWNAIELAYAITVHSDQGSEHDNVIFGLDFSAYNLLTRELVYTGITRAKNKCELIAQTGALRMAIAHEGVTCKQTFLEGILRDLAHPKFVF